ncbi:efflux RND transporter periplasmic adaptor subunit [Cellulosilyticum ruminicola]|uniref:efflux RND transporter periplasmic adaptor subunit n=1 Tax=Cellulosilyticum ruminicola TaxID=425254 RepID=UPI0006D01207|nr:efflux RND transporter periplasmic adaptor subunit [Cellulosilyticum ruminicola]
MKKLAPALFICMAIILSSCGASNTETSSNTETVATTEDRPIAVSVQNVKSGNIVKANTFSGRTKSSGDTSVTAETVGKIQKVHVSTGQRVQKGDVLLTIDATDLNKSIEQAKVSLETAQRSYESAIGGSVSSQINQLENAVTNAQIGYDEAKRNYDMYKELYDAETITEDQFKKIELALLQSEQGLQAAQSTLDITKNQVIPESQKLAKQNVSQAQVAYDTAKSNLSKLIITAPVSGTITTSNFKDGEMIAQSAPAFVISNLGTLKVELQVTETDVIKFKVGNSLAVTISDTDVKGTVAEVSKVPNTQTGLYTVDITVDNSNNKFLAGMAAEAKLIDKQSNETLIIARNAIFEEDGQKYVYVCKDNHAVKTAVETGLTNVDTVEITSGINSGDSVVIEGLSLIEDGTFLYPVEKKEA